MREVLAAVQDKEDAFAEKVAAKANKSRDEEGRIYYWVMAARQASEIGHAILEMYEDAEYAAMLMPIYYKVEMRADGKVNVGNIARLRGGGGHPNASGYELGFADLATEMARFAGESLMSRV